MQDRREEIAKNQIVNEQNINGSINNDDQNEVETLGEKNNLHKEANEYFDNLEEILLSFHYFHLY